VEVGNGHHLLWGASWKLSSDGTTNAGKRNGLQVHLCHSLASSTKRSVEGWRDKVDSLSASMSLGGGHQLLGENRGLCDGFIARPRIGSACMQKGT